MNKAEDREARRREIVAMIRESGLAQIDFAGIVGVSIQTVKAWCSAARLPSWYVIRLIRYKLRNQGYLR